MLNVQKEKSFDRAILAVNMNNDELAFINQQLAAMLRDGLPLEGALRRLGEGMRHGSLRTELQKMGQDLAKGVPLREAAHARNLPDLYKQMLEVGAQSNDLPGILTMLADHYQRRNTIWTRLKGLMVYPTIVLCGAFALSCFITFLLTHLTDLTVGWWWPYQMTPSSPPVIIGIWAPPVLLGVAVAALLTGINVQQVRRALKWRVPAFKEASLADVASTVALMLKSGVALNDALGMVEKLEQGSPAEKELSRWRQRLSAGQGKFAEMAASSQVFPPLFVWMVSQSGEDLASGFQHAAETYRSRATYRTDALLYSALPCSVLALAVVIISQIRPVMALFVSMMNAIGDNSGMTNSM